MRREPRNPVKAAECPSFCRILLFLFAKITTCLFGSCNRNTHTHTHTHTLKGFLRGVVNRTEYIEG